jgi:hypothetical protein
MSPGEWHVSCFSHRSEAISGGVMGVNWKMSAGVVVVLALTASAARAQGLRPVRTTRVAVGFAGLLAQPTGVFADYVGVGGGVGGHVVWTPGGVVGLRADASYLIYGHETRWYPFLPLVDVGVATNNQIAGFQIGPQLTFGSRGAQVYGFGQVGFSYFFTSSSVKGSANVEPFASTTNFDDFAFATSAGGGVRLQLSRGRVPVALDLGARFLHNSRARYLTQDGIAVDGNTIYYAPIESQTSLVIYSLGVTIGL